MKTQKVKVMSEVEGINEKEFKNLTWQYFWQQKLREVGIFFGVIAGIGVVGLCSYFIGQAIVRGEDKFLNTMIGSLIFVAIAMVSYVLYEWLHGNWETAKERAIEKLRGEKNEK